MLARKALAGTAGAPKEYVEDVFSTYLYTGNSSGSSTQTITNNIDLAGDGGLVWIKQRDAGTFDTFGHALVDSARGITKVLKTNATAAEQTISDAISSFNADGFTAGGSGYTNNNTDTYASWTFRKAKKFFDVVTYTGNGSNRTISHNLGSVPGCIIIKDTTNAGSVWAVYHRSIGNTKYLQLQSTGAEATSSGYWNNTDPTSTEFTVGTNGNVNQNGATFVAYLFAHDAGGFGDAGSDSIIKCDTFTTASATLSVTLGWEPQWILFKRSDSTGDWQLYDNMRGMVSGGSQRLYPNLSNAEDVGAGIQLTATGFEVNTTYNATFIYIAIRRGPMKTPTSGTSVFKPNTYTGTGADQTITGVGFAPDFILNKDRNAANANLLWDRMRGSSKYLVTSSTAAEATWDIGFDSMDGFRLIGGGTGVNASGGSYVHWFFKRAPGFFDVVCYTGNATARTISHNLGVAPELMIVKMRDGAGNYTSNHWFVYAAPLGATKRLLLSADSAELAVSAAWNDTAPTSSVFSLGTGSGVNGLSPTTYVAYLFASLSGVSKVGSYTGNGSSVTVTTDFQPRFIMVKRTDSTGNWIVSDSARGLVAGSDPYLLLNSTAAEDTDEDWVDITSTSFTVNQTTAANANVNTGTYIYLAIA